MSWWTGSVNSVQENQSAGLSLAQGSRLELQLCLFASISLGWQRPVSDKRFVGTLDLLQIGRP